MGGVFTIRDMPVSKRSIAIVEVGTSYRHAGWFPCREPATRRIECIELMLDARMIFLRNSACRVAFNFGDSAKKLHPMSNAWDVPDHHHLMKMYSPIKSVLVRGLAALFMIAIPAWAGTQEESKVVEQPPVKTTEPWEINVGGPGWLASVSGHSGFHGHNPYIDVGVGQILKNINVIGALVSMGAFYT
jgi:hypothetical protein